MQELVIRVALTLTLHFYFGRYCPYLRQVNFRIEFDAKGALGQEPESSFRVFGVSSTRA